MRTEFQHDRLREDRICVLLERWVKFKLKLDWFQEKVKQIQLPSSITAKQNKAERRDKGAMSLFFLSMFIGGFLLYRHIIDFKIPMCKMYVECVL